MSANRCGSCLTNWPLEVKECPECDPALNPKIRISFESSPIDEDEARKRIGVAGFRKFLKEETLEERAAREARDPLRQRWIEQEAARFSDSLEQL